MQNEKRVDFATEQGPINLEATVEGQNLNDLIIVDLFCLQIIESIDPFRLVISVKDLAVSTSKTFIEDVKRDLPIFLKALGVIKICKFYVHKTKPTTYAYSLHTQKPVPFFSSSHREEKIKRIEADKVDGKMQPPEESKSKKNYFSLIGDSITGAFGIFVFLKDSFCNLFKDEREW